MNPALLELARIGLTSAIHALMANEKASAIVLRMQAEGRRELTPEEAAEMDTESAAIHALHESSINRAKAEGR